jgi:tripartite-type tricarboxylate transporter receptor subunit TctC
MTCNLPSLGHRVLVSNVSGMASGLRLRWRWWARAPLVAAVALAFLASEVRAQAAKEFYSGRQIRFAIGSAGGGGYDFYSRLVGRFMNRHLPGNPFFVMQNMPGAGGVIVANYLYNIAPHDGSEIGMVARGAATQPLLDPKDRGPRYVATRFNWIGTPQQEVGLLLVRQPSPIKTLADLKTHELILSGTSPVAPTSLYPRMLNRLVGTKFKVIEGYKSSQDSLLAVERGEVEGHSSGSSAAPLRDRIAPWVQSGKVKVLAQIGLARDPEYPDVPLILDLATTAQDRQIMELALTQQLLAWPIVAPPDVPADRVKALRDAFDATMTDADFLAEAGRQKLIINPVSGLAINALLDRAYATAPDVLERVRSLSARE